MKQYIIVLTEPRRALQLKGTLWFPRIRLFVVHAISLGPCRRPIEFLISLHPCGHLSKIPNSQIHKVKKWKILSNFRRKDFFVISHGHKDRFFVVIRPKKTPGHIKYWPRIDPFFSKNQNFDPKHRIPNNQWEKLNRFHYSKFQNFDYLEVPYFCRINLSLLIKSDSHFLILKNQKTVLSEDPPVPASGLHCPPLNNI